MPAGESSAALTLDGLAGLRHWVAWQAEPGDGGQARKVPYDPATGRPARSNDSSTWGTRAEAEARAAALPLPLKLGGPGFELGDIGGGLSVGGVDLDTCRDPETGAFLSWAEDVIACFASYTEVSPSLRGAKVFFAYKTADLPALRAAVGVADGASGRRWGSPTGAAHPPGIELYLGGRYFAVTDMRVEGTPAEIRIVPIEVIEWLARDAVAALAPPRGRSAARVRDDSRSAIAFRIGRRARREGRSYEEMCREIRANPATAEWAAKDGERGLRRIWANSERYGAPLATQAPPIGLGEWDAGEDSNPIEPRGWLLGNQLCRRFISTLIAGGGTGKTALRTVQMLALASGRELTDEKVFHRCRVLMLSLEDGEDELRRRVRAAMIHHELKPEDVAGHLYLSTPRNLKLAEPDESGRPRYGAFKQSLEAAICRLGIDVICVDPFVKAHGMEENDNMAIDFVAEVLAGIAADYDCAVDVIHHTRKGPAEGGEADRSRGASAFVNAARLAYTLTQMTEAEADLFRVPREEHKHYVRLDSAKVNIAPPLDRATWFRLVGVPLGNASELYPHGDTVQAIEPWTPPQVWSQVTAEVANRILDRLSAGLADGRRYAAAGQAAHEQQPWTAVLAELPSLTEGQARQVIKRWLADGVLRTGMHHDPVVRKDRKSIYVDDAKRPAAARAIDLNG